MLNYILKQEIKGNKAFLVLKDEFARTDYYTFKNTIKLLKVFSAINPDIREVKIITSYYVIDNFKEIKINAEAYITINEIYNFNNESTKADILNFGNQFFKQIN